MLDGVDPKDLKSVERDETIIELEHAFMFIAGFMKNVTDGAQFTTEEQAAWTRSFNKMSTEEYPTKILPAYIEAGKRADAKSSRHITENEAQRTVLKWCLQVMQQQTKDSAVDYAAFENKLRALNLV
jgi:hypothetical protein